MWKQAWRSYWTSLHPRNLKKAENGIFFNVLYWLVIYPSIMGFTQNNFEVSEVIYLTMARLIPFLLMKWSNLGSKFLMTKMMFLSPMKEEERKDYINCVLVIKIGVSIFFGILIETICSIFYGFSMLRMIILTIMNFSMGIATYISLEAMGKMDEKIYAIVKDKSNSTKGHWINTMVIILAVVGIGAVSILDIGAEASLAFFEKVFIGVAMIILLVSDIKMLTGEYEVTIALACDYELSFGILGKVNKQVKFDLFEKRGG